METVTSNFNKSIGIFCTLHNLCNLNCKFCFETENGIRKYSDINLNYIKQLPDEIITVVSPIISANNLEHAAVDIMGGELFSDNIPDSMFDVYREFVYELQSKLRKEIPNIKFRFTFFTNGVFTKHERVRDLILATSAKLNMSYDPIDRFASDKQRELWYSAFKYFKDTTNIKIAVSTVLTKKNIYAYINGDEIFEKIGNALYIEAQEYSPRLDYEEYLPNDDDIFNFYKWALDNGKFNIDTIMDIINHIPHCNKGFTYAFSEGCDGKYTNYCIDSSSLSKELFYGSHSKSIKDDTKLSNDTIHWGFEKRGCLLCEYYTKCSKMCWLQILLNEYQISICPISRVYKYLEENPNVLVNYNKWRDQYGKLRSPEKETKEN